MIVEGIAGISDEQSASPSIAALVVIRANVGDSRSERGDALASGVWWRVSHKKAAAKITNRKSSLGKSHKGIELRPKVLHHNTERRKEITFSEIGTDLCLHARAIESAVNRRR